MIYHGKRQNSAGAIYRLGLALFDLEAPERCLMRGDEWIFECRDRGLQKVGKAKAQPHDPPDQGALQDAGDDRGDMRNGSIAGWRGGRDEADPSEGQQGRDGQKQASGDDASDAFFGEHDLDSFPSG